MPRPWSLMSRREKKRVNARSKERMKRYRRDGRYGAEWTRYHREARKLLEDSGKERVCYSCGTTERPLRTHHVDGDYTNNDVDNLEWCCHSCDTKEAYARKSAGGM